MTAAATLRSRIAGRAPAQSQAAPAHFVPDHVLRSLASLTPDAADALDFGVIRVDDQGRVLLYNRYESELGGVDPAHAQGRNFFTQVAPCTNNALFFGAFRKGVALSQLNATFPYTFTYKMRPTPVRVHLYRCPDSRTNWVFIKSA